MLKRSLKWAIAPVVAIAMVTGLSAFTGTGEDNHGHAVCIDGSTGICHYRDCTTSGCQKQVHTCDIASWFETPNCKR